MMGSTIFEGGRGMFVGGMRPGMGGLRWPRSSAGSSTPSEGIGGAAAAEGVGGLGCLRRSAAEVMMLSWFTCAILCWIIVTKQRGVREDGPLFESFLLFENNYISHFPEIPLFC